MRQSHSESASQQSLAALELELSLWRRIFRRISDLRDALFIFLSLAYALGYASWATFAYQNGIGPLFSPVDAQYLVSGLLPAVFAFFVYALSILVRGMVAWGKKRQASENQLRLGGMLESAGAFTVMGSIVLFVTLRENGMAFALAAGAGFVVILAAAFVYGGRGTPWLFSTLSWTITIALIFFGLKGAQYYLSKVFPALPQEFGGPAARCVTFDIAADEVSATTLDSLLVTDFKGSVKDYVRTRKVGLVFEGAGYAIIELPRRALPNHPMSGHRNFIRLSSSLIRGTFPCDSYSGSPNLP